MHGVAHKITGLCAGVLCGGWLHSMGHGMPEVIATAAFFAGSAPDYLEFPVKTKFGGQTRLIAHRTWTHWVPPWIALLGVGAVELYLYNSLLANAIVGFAVGGLTHLCMDIPNPKGVWLLLPRRPVSLKLWKSGSGDLLISAACLAAAWPVAKQLIEEAVL